MRVEIFIEGGGQDAGNKTIARKAFSDLFGKVVPGSRPRVRICGGGDEAIEKFVTATKNTAVMALLLIDLDQPPSGASRRMQLIQSGKQLRDVDDDAVHCMVQLSETWIVADPGALRRRYRSKPFTMPNQFEHGDLEAINGPEILGWLKMTFGYTKADGLGLIGQLDHTKLRDRCPHAARLFDRLQELSDPSVVSD